MDTTPPTTKVAPCWKAYASAGAFILPCLLAWIFSTVFLFPKLQEIWAHSGFDQPTFVSILRCANFVLAHGVSILATLVLLFGLLEWHGGAWPRYRRVSLGIGTWFLNAAVLLLLTAMLLSALVAAPGLIPQQ